MLHLPSPLKFTLVRLFVVLLTLLGLGASQSHAEVNVAKYPFPESYFSSDFKRALNYFGSADFSALTDELVKLKQKNPRRFPMEKVHLLEGLSLQEQSQHQAAILSFKAGLKLRGANSDLLYLIAESELALALLPNARQSVQEALWFSRFEIVPKERAYYLLGMIEKTAELPLQAIAALKLALAQNAAYQPARMTLGEVYLSSGQKAEAIAIYREALAKEQENANLKLSLAKALLLNPNRATNKRELKEAEDLVSQVMQSKDTDIALKDARPVYIRALIENGNIAKASQSLTLALKKDPNNLELKKLSEQIILEKSANQQTLAQEATLLPK